MALRRAKDVNGQTVFVPEKVLTHPYFAGAYTTEPQAATAMPEPAPPAKSGRKTNPTVTEEVIDNE
ncbi:MAG: hypothetical protein FWG25_11260 [Promicromonosporaceae bacterium]|nr:hypothetical protein [Promicromonosporaceae bacterium]